MLAGDPPWFVAVGASEGEGLNDIKALLVALPSPLRAVILVVLATDELPRDGDHRNYMVVVRDADGHAVYSAALSFVGTRLSR